VSNVRFVLLFSSGLLFDGSGLLLVWDCLVFVVFDLFCLVLGVCWNYLFWVVLLFGSCILLVCCVLVCLVLVWVCLVSFCLYCGCSVVGLVGLLCFGSRCFMVACLFGRLSAVPGCLVLWGINFVLCFGEGLVY
jgi:hypothetical protein